MPLAAGCSALSGEQTESPTSNSTASPTDSPTTTPTDDDMTPTNTQPDAIDPRFGYIGTSDEEPPVQADHTVDLLIRERENVPIPEFYFEPTGLSVDPGATVRFNLATPHHNVNAYHPAFGYTQRVPDGVAPFSSPILGVGDYWLYTFEQEGVHNIMCAPHELFGMVGTVVVGSATGPGANPVGEAPGGQRARPPEFTAALVLSDPAMDPEAIVEQGSVSWSDLADESKRPLLRPVEEGGGGGTPTGTPTPTPTN
jgi:plastocyanin